jgi:hypothetical protein
MLKIRILAAALSMAVVTGPAWAGCLTGAAVGAVAGHVAGHHAVLGGAAGCAIGHHEKAVSEKRDRQQSQNVGDQSDPAQR